MSLTKPKTIAVIGASGYTGMEIIRYLQGCPQFELTTIVGNRTAGSVYSDIYPAFTGIVDLVVQGAESVGSLSTDAVVLALPHGKSMQV
ncbi:MAG TPA: N-acetyl-gamma-glutamyl-phosphate reductase, partial [Bacteroidetes bacterium]|nr:N-acetyl-gamma-glutamyl-phosphate reductase [Bacteroidota bacterium]